MLIANYLRPAMIALLALAALAGWASQPANANHGQTAIWPSVDYMALDADVTGNTSTSLNAGEPPWDSCINAAQSSTVDLDIVIDRVPDIPNNGSRKGLSAIQALVRYDSALVSKTSITTLYPGNPTILGFAEGSALVTSDVNQNTTGTVKTDFISVVDIGAASQEDNITGVGIRMEFDTTPAGAGGGFAQVTLLESFGGFSSKILAHSTGPGGSPPDFVESATIQNFTGGSRAGDANDQKVVNIAISPATCGGADSDGDGVQDSSDNCAGVPNGLGEAGIPGIGNQANADADAAAANWRMGAGSPPPLMTGDANGDACDSDDDDDFFQDIEEQRVYDSAGFAGEQLAPCDTGPSDVWPPDMSPSGALDHVIDTGDVIFILGFVGLGPASPGYSVRYDISSDAGNAIDTGEVLLILGFVGMSCQQGLP